MTTPSPFESAYRDVLEEIVDWREERKAENLTFYVDAFANNQVTVTPGREHTKQKSNCDVCLRSQEPGIRSFFHRGRSFFRFQVCESCFGEITKSPKLAELNITDQVKAMSTAQAV